jgi:pantetheine-phosphate adenylyltransferase
MTAGGMTTMSERLGLYPGTFDPITRGHLDIIQRATRVVDRLVVAVAVSDGKEPLFGLDERVQMVREEVRSLGADVAGRIEVRSFSSLLVHFAQEVGAKIIVRGLRAVSDFEYEFQMTGMNQRLTSEIETVFLMASERYQFISSRFVKEICRLDGDISQFVSPAVESRVKARYAKG